MTFAIGLAEKYHGLLSALMGAVRRAERFLGPEDDWVEEDRRVLYEAFDGTLGHSTTFEKGPRDYFTTADASPDKVEEALHPHYQRNLASTRKYRTHHGGGKQWACGSWVHDPPETDTQHHVFLFKAPDGRTDLYGHFETSVRDPDGHLQGDTWKAGDPNGRARALLDEAGITFERRDL